MWKTNAKQDGCKGQGPAMKQKTPASGTADDKPSRQRRQDYDGGNANTRRA